MDNEYNQIYQLKITLKDIKPSIWRRIQVPESYSFWDLHLAVQDAMGWFDDHLHAFYIKNPETGEQDELSPHMDPLIENNLDKLSSWDIRISQYLTPENNSALYLYDFGDNWLHNIKLEKIFPRRKDIQYPICLDGKKACPPEDCGGAPGYADLLQIISDHDDEDYDDIIEWIGEDFDPEYFDIGDVIFEDPNEHWEELYGELENPDEEWPDEINKESKTDSLMFLHDIWEKVKIGDLEGLSPEELTVAKIMKDHEEEFFNQFEFADLLSDHEYDQEGEVDPFLHIFIHSIIEDQLESRNPPEAFQFYNSMIEKGCSHHEAVHSTGAILSLLLPPVLQNSGPFDIGTYKYLLNKYITKEPEDLFELLEQEDI